MRATGWRRNAGKGRMTSANQPYQIAGMAGGYKAYPFMKVPFYAAVQLNGAGRTIKLYPHGAMDVIGARDETGKANIKTLNYDGSYETGQLKNGRKDGVFVFYNRQKKEIGRCTYVRGRAADGETVLAAGGEYIRYIYKAGKLTAWTASKRTAQESRYARWKTANR